LESNRAFSKRAWGTVREDYSANGQAWQYFPYDHARSRAYRWNEMVFADLSDRGATPLFRIGVLERGAIPSSRNASSGSPARKEITARTPKSTGGTSMASWLRWRYHYRRPSFPYARLRQENARRNKDEHEFELIDAGFFEADRYWRITVEYAKRAPDDVCARIALRNAGPDPAELHVLPTLWFRNRCSWEAGGR
jgi:hypothetical protein